MYDPEEHGNLLLMGNQTKRFNPLKKVVGQTFIKLSENSTSLLIDSDGLLSGFDDTFSSDDELQSVKKTILENIDYRLNNLEEDMPWLYVYITDMAKFIEKTNINNSELEKILHMSTEVKIALVMGLDSTFMSSDITGVARLYKKYIKSMVLTMRKQDRILSKLIMIKMKLIQKLEMPGQNWIGSSLKLNILIKGSEYYG
ncbi:hypothetical protein [Ligilactobacillus aviarius]|uniref:hypothetical protein n=1 Tax=Ligilactobacillus aviarius TaxID=1606 RepID=UPI0024B9646C|nr:hypothetical protein [Ligilactobacillus aviarius]